jgi:predicted ABC-type ATPase
VARTSFAIETTLRTEITFEQAARAKTAGFITEMRYLALRDFTMHLERISSWERIVRACQEGFLIGRKS